MLSLLQLAYVVARRRIVSSWRLELVLFLGILLAVGLLSSSVAFSDLLAEASIRRALAQATAEEATFRLRAFNDLEDPSVIPEERSAYRSGLNFVAERVTPLLDPYLSDRAFLLETSTFFFEGGPDLELANNVRPRGKLQYLSSLGERGRTEIVRGRWPQDGEGPASGALEVAIDDLGAQLLGLGVGDGMRVFPASGVEPTGKAIPVEIVGVFRRLDPQDDFWYGASRAFSITGNDWLSVPLFTTERAITDRVARLYPGLYSNVTWMFTLDRQGVEAGDVGALQETILRVRYEARANLDNSSVAIRLHRVLDRYEEQLILARVPLFLMVFLVVGILAYYLALVAALIARSRTVEISMLKSRGATTFQLGLLVMVEGLLLAIPALIAGIVLSPPVARVLGGFFFEVGGSRPAPAALSSEAILLGIAGALLAVAVLTVATIVAARQGIVELHQTGARPPRAPFIHRYYLDLLLLPLIGLIWWQIQNRGSFLVRSLGTGEFEIDFTLLLGPVLELLALGLLVMRFFPWALAIAARAAEPVGPAWLVQGLRHVSRDPIMPGSLVVLLMLATALGVIGSAFSSTLEQSQQDRGRYAVGADFRVEHNGDRSDLPLLGLAGRAEDSDSVARVAEAQRTSGQLSNRGFSPTRVSVLAVDTESFAQVAWFRPDFARGKSLEDLTGALSLAPAPASSGAASFAASSGAPAVSADTGESQSDGIELPANATGLAVWAHPGRPGSRLALMARLQDSGGLYFDVALGELSSREWQRLEAPLVLAEPSRGPPQGQPPPTIIPPVTLLGVQVSSQLGISEPGILFLDDLAVITTSGEEVREEVIADFQTTDGWRAVEDYARPGLYSLDSSASVARAPGGRSAAFSWAPGGLGFRGLRAGGPEQPIPAVVSQSVAGEVDAGVGDTVNLAMSTFTVPIRIVAFADYFPTLDPREQAFVVLDLRTFNHYANRHNRRVSGGTNELWGSAGGENPDLTSVDEALAGQGLRARQTFLASQEIAFRAEQPLANAGWGGLLILMFLTLTLASASGVALFSFMDTRERQTEFALLRTLGSSKGQLNGVVWFNLFLVVACGIGLGTWAGLQIGASLLPVMEVAEGGVRVTPPMILRTNWTTLLGSYLVLAAVTGGAVVWLAWLTAKLQVQQVLRAGEL